MTYSRQPWTARGHDLLDAGGRVIATFTDPRDMDLVTGGFPSSEDVEGLKNELDTALAERDEEARAVNAARAEVEVLEAKLAKVQAALNEGPS